MTARRTPHPHPHGPDHAHHPGPPGEHGPGRRAVYAPPGAHGHWPRHARRWAMLAAGVAWVSGGVLWLWPREQWLDLAPWLASACHGALIAHGVVAWWLCALFGRWVGPHVRRRRHRWPARAWVGAGLLALTTVLGVTGLALLYASADLQPFASTVHSAIGLAIPLAIAVHVAGLTRRR